MAIIPLRFLFRHQHANSFAVNPAALSDILWDGHHFVEHQGARHCGSHHTAYCEKLLVQLNL